MRALAFDEYERLSASGGLVPVFREMPGDLLTPVSAFAAVAGRASRAFLLESVVGGERVARYSFLGRDPIVTVTVEGGDHPAIVEHGTFGRRVIDHQATGAGLLAALRARLGAGTAEVAGLPRFTGGAVGYFSYDAIRLFERIPSRLGPPRRPVASFSFYRSLVAFDHARQRLVLICNAEPGRRAAWERAQEELDALEADLAAARPLRAPRRGASGPASLAGGLGADGGFTAAVARAQEHIAAGDVFQVVLSRQHAVPCAADPLDVYRALRMVNPSPYMFLLKEGATSVAGASPEMLVRVEGRRVETRPLAGTRRRGASEEEDRRLEDQLRSDAKERAEHLMLVDLGRNDLGRVCRFGSVAVPELMATERYSHVTHLVSSVTGELAEGKDALDALVAAFPAGTLTGAPKIRAMEIIDALEPAPRGMYGGTLGYVDLRGNLDFCIAIRTLVLEAGRATLQAGAGIVADSDPLAELAETEAKAAVLAEALHLAESLR